MIFVNQRRVLVTFPLLEVGFRSPLNLARGLGERRKLSQRGLRYNPSPNQIWCILTLKYYIWWQQSYWFPQNQLTKYSAVCTVLRSIVTTRSFVLLFEHFFLVPLGPRRSAGDRVHWTAGTLNFYTTANLWQLKRWMQVLYVDCVIYQPYHH